MFFIYKCAMSNIRNNFFLIFGLFLGVALSSLMSQIVQNRCAVTLESGHILKPNQLKIADQDDYEPVINLAGKPLRAQKIPRNFQRPRYYKTELGIREKLLIAVLTSPGTIKDYGEAFNKTTYHVFDKIVFFMESEANKSKSEVRWNGVVQFSDSKIVLKPFHLLKYLIDNFLDDFDYFFLVHDKTYVRGRKLYDLVKKLSVSEIVHVGSRFSSALKDFCSLNAGILLSNTVLKKISSKLDWCIKNAVVNSDNTNLGRCIIHSSGVPCKTSVSGHTFSAIEFNNTMTDMFEKLEPTEEFNQAITVWPVSSPAMSLKLHAYFAKAEIFEKKSEIQSVRNKIIKQSAILPDNVTEKISWPIGIPVPQKAANRFDLLRWDYFDEKQIYLKNDFSNTDVLSGADLFDVQNIVNASVKFVEQQSDKHLKFTRLSNGYRRFDPSRGMDYILDIVFTNIMTGTEIFRRLQICKPLGKVELIPMPYVTENARVNMIVAVDEDKKKDIFKFLENYVVVCMEKKEKTFLIVVLLYKAQLPGKGNLGDTFGELKKTVQKYSNRFKNNGNKIAWLSVNIPEENISVPDLFLQGGDSVFMNSGILRIALLDLVVKRFAVDNLLLYCTSNMEIRQDYLNRVRMNTIRGYQVFSPIPFSEFDPNIVYGDDLLRPKEMDISRNYGHYDILNREAISFYVKDYRNARKEIENYVPVVHTDRDIAEMAHYFKNKLERIKHEEKIRSSSTPSISGHPFVRNIIKLSLHSLFGMFVDYKNINVLRAVEPGLRLRHEVVECKRLVNHNDLIISSLHSQCLKRRNFNSGSRSQLGHFILEFLRVCNK